MRLIIQIIKYIFFLGVALLLAWFSLRDVDVHQVWEDIKNAHLLILLPTFIILMLSHWIRGLRWNLIIHSIGYQPRAWHSFLSLLAGYFANLLVPRFGELLRCTALSKKEKIPLDKLVGTVIIERAIDLVVLLLLTLVAFLLQIEEIGGFFAKNIHQFPTQKIILMGLIFLGGVVLVAWVLWHYRKYRWVRNILRLLANVWEGIVAIKRLPSVPTFFLHTAGIWLCYFLAILLGCQALEATQSLRVVPSLSILVMGSIGMILTQGGVGAYPLLVAETVAWYAISESSGVALGWLLWLSQVLMTIVAGLFAWTLLFSSSKTN